VRRLIAPILSLLLILGVGYLVFLSVGRQFGGPILLRGVIGSEKEDFFRDPELIGLLKNKGFSVEVTKAGSRAIAASFDSTGMDFAFPSGTPAADKIRRDKKAAAVYNVFYTPMVIASWQPIVKLLVKAGVAFDKGKYGELDIKKFLALLAGSKRWSDLPNNAEYPVNKPILVSSTDVRSSNSAAMYLSLLSYALNGDNVAQDASEAQRLAPLVAPFFLKQGYQEASSQGAFDDYLLIGMGKSPLVFIYESQFIEKFIKNTIKPSMRLLYPTPTVFTKHIWVPLSPNGDKLGQLMSTDPDIQRIAARYGFRSSDINTFDNAVQQYKLPIKENLVDVIDPPSYDVLEAMIKLIEGRF
jgi:hypothetical protein